MGNQHRGLAFAALLCFASTAHGQDVTALKASFEAEIDALNRRDLPATLAAVDDRIVLFGIFSPFPITGKEGLRQAVQEYFEAYEYAVFRPIDPAFRVVGTTGVAWGNFRLATTLKQGSSTYADGRYMFTYAQSAGKWVLLSMHYSLLTPLVH
jgi:ketosteroid isomerase-like protein